MCFRIFCDHHILSAFVRAMSRIRLNYRCIHCLKFSHQHQRLQVVFRKRQCRRPGFLSIAPGRGDIIIPPVSVCHHVSTIGDFASPTTLKYQFHAFRINWFTDSSKPQTGSVCAFNILITAPMRALIAVGAV